jgi:hypothetical protein
MMFSTEVASQCISKTINVLNFEHKTFWACLNDVTDEYITFYSDVDEYNPIVKY